MKGARDLEAVYFSLPAGVRRPNGRNGGSTKARDKLTWYLSVSASETAG